VSLIGNDGQATGKKPDRLELRTERIFSTVDLNYIRREELQTLP